MKPRATHSSSSSEASEQFKVDSVEVDSFAQCEALSTAASLCLLLCLDEGKRREKELLRTILPPNDGRLLLLGEAEADFSAPLVLFLVDSTGSFAKKSGKRLSGEADRGRRRGALGGLSKADGDSVSS